MKKKECICDKREIKVKYERTCVNCKGFVKGFLISRGYDSCGSFVGLTDFSGQFKIFRCDHYIYCPLCQWRCKNIEELKRHLEGFVPKTDYSRRSCEGFFYYGQNGIDIVLNEIKYYKLRKKNLKLSRY